MEKITLTTATENKLFAKHILVSNSGENQFETLVTLANKFGIRIINGIELVNPDMIKVCASELGKYVSEPFYRGFPDTVRELTSDELLFDQIVSYIATYGFGNFSQTSHSMLEDFVERKAFQEDVTPKDFSVITIEEAMPIIRQMFDNLMASTRPLSDGDLTFVYDCIESYNFLPTEIASKNTGVLLFLKYKNTAFLKGMKLSDTIKIVDELNWSEYENKKLNKLAFHNADKKLVSKVIDYFFDNDLVNTRECFEKKKIWCGLLHHIHYKADTQAKREFCSAMRGKVNHSAYSEFELKMNVNPSAAAHALKQSKGNGELLRKLNYIISRCNNDDEIKAVINEIDASNGIVLLQMLFQYANYASNGNRTFMFTKHNLQKVHTETEEEVCRRKSVLTSDKVHILSDAILSLIKEHYSNTLGKVYISDSMKKYALPIQETTASSGFGVMTKGSRIAIPNGKKIRAFTYWEKVHDIDLSCFGITSKGDRIEFSWRTMSKLQSNAITYSGDETSGYNGGSEYFDIDIEAFKKQYPEVTHIILCNNVYSSLNFSQCICKAGFMMRDIEDSGEVYEPKTVSTAFEINADSTFAYLFAIDLNASEMIWLNIAKEGRTAIAGTTEMNFLTRYFSYTNTMSVYKFASICATEVVDDPSKADIAFTEYKTICPEVIHGYDVEKIMALIEI